MELKTSTFFYRKRYFLSVLAGVAFAFSSTPAFSQVDYFYGLNRTGFRVSVGGGVSKLDSNWGTNPFGAVGTADVDYDFSQYFSIGLQGQYGKLSGKDTKAINGVGTLTPGSTDVTFGGGDLDFKVAIGSFAKFSSHSIMGDIFKRFYVGAGIGVVSSQVTLTPHNLVAPGYQPGLNVVNSYLQPSMRKTIETDRQVAKGSGSFAYIPVNVGTYISLRKLTKKDKFELNPNFQYSFVQNPKFDGYQPATAPIGSISANGNQGYMLISLAVRYKF